MSSPSKIYTASSAAANSPCASSSAVQVLIQNRVISRALNAKQILKPPLLVKMLNRFPRLRRIPARLVGIGYRPEHVHTPDAFSKK